MQAFDISRENVAAWLVQKQAGHVAEVLEEFERLLGRISRHRGPVHADAAEGHFNAIWQSPYDCLTYFAEWRLVIADAVRGTFAPVFFSPSWLTETVVGLRDAILAERAFDRLSILADALEEAGCDCHTILDHLRANDDHAHMCWVLDVLNAGDGRPDRSRPKA